MSIPAPRRRMSIQEFRLLPEDPRQWELVDGEVTMTPTPTPAHQTISRKLQYQLMQQLELTGLAQIFNAPMNVELGDENSVQPDLMIISSARSAIIGPRVIEGVPDVLVEIVSPAGIARDRKLKFALYARSGVLEYWIVDPARAELEAYRLVEGSYQLRDYYSQASVLTCPDFPTLSIQLAWVFG